MGQRLEQGNRPWILKPKGGCPSKNHRHIRTHGHHRDTAPTQGGAKEEVKGEESGMEGEIQREKSDVSSCSSSCFHWSKRHLLYLPPKPFRAPSYCIFTIETSPLTSQERARCSERVKPGEGSRKGLSLCLSLPRVPPSPSPQETSGAFLNSKTVQPLTKTTNRAGRSSAYY